MIGVVPPAAPALLPLSKWSQNTEPSAVSWSKWTWASMPPGTAIRPVESISFFPLFIPFAYQSRGQGLRDVVDRYHKRADGKSLIDYAFHVILSDPSEKIMGQDLD